MREPTVSPTTTNGGHRLRTFLLWAGFLVPLGAWMLQLFALYMLEDFISCTPGSRTPGYILGIEVRPIALAITACLALITIIFGVSSFALWRKMSEKPARNDGRGARWLARAGVMNSVLFTMIILIKAVPPLVLGVCEAAL